MALYFGINTHRALALKFELQVQHDKHELCLQKTRFQRASYVAGKREREREREYIEF